MPSLEDSFQDASVLGEGAHGKVYAATACRDYDGLAAGSPVAIKLLHPTAEEASRRLLQRRDRLTSLAHPAIARIYEIGQFDDGSTFVISELLSGGTLKERMEDFRSPAKVLRLFSHIVDAVAYLHAEALAHRDIKPSNVMFGEAEGDMPKLVDLDLVRRVPAHGSSISMAGTPEYSAPELRADGELIGLEVDTYSIGVVLYEILAGRLPTAASDDWRPSRHNRAVRGWLDQLVLGCLQEKPERRYTALQLADAIKACAEQKFPASPISHTPDYPTFKRGDVDLDVVLLQGGDRIHRYEYPDGIEVELDYNDLHIVPDRLFDATEDWLRWREADASSRGAPFENRRQPRVISAGSPLTEDQHELLHPLRLRLGITDYYTTQCTNFASNLLLRDLSTVRESHGAEHNNFSDSDFANPLATNLSVVTCGGGTKTIFMTQRGRLVGGNPEFDEFNRVPAVSGTGHPVYDVDEGRGNPVFCPFVAGKREAKEETLGDYDVGVHEITYFGFARTGLMMFPFLFGEIRLVDMTAEEFGQQTVLHRNDVYKKEGRPFTIESVTSWIRELYFRYDENGRLASRPSHTGIFSLYQSLVYEYPDQVVDINSLLRQ